VARFAYKAITRTGSHTSGLIEAPDRRSAVAGLAEKGQFVIELAESVQGPTLSGKERLRDAFGRLARLGSRRIRGREILAMTSQLGAALRAGLPLLDALVIIRDQQTNNSMRQLLDELAGAVKSGQSLSEALETHPGIFSRLYISMIRVGETGGILEKTTQQLATILARDEKIKTSMKNASAYPLFVLTLGLVSAAVVVTVVLPMVLRTIAGDVEMLPLPTRLLLGLSAFIKGYGWLVVLIVLVGGYLFRIWTSSAGRARWDAFKLRVPVLGSVLKTIAVGRFARTLGALTRGGVTILEALGVVRDTLGNEVLAKEVDKVTEKVKAGSSLAGPLGTSGYFPPLLVQIVSVGEQTGKLDELLLDAADTFDADADAAIAKFMAVFPAVLILLLALIIGFIIAATLLPIVIMSLGGGML